MAALLPRLVDASSKSFLGSKIKLVSLLEELKLAKTSSDEAPVGTDMSAEQWAAALASDPLVAACAAEAADNGLCAEEAAATLLHLNDEAAATATGAADDLWRWVAKPDTLLHAVVAQFVQRIVQGDEFEESAVMLTSLVHAIVRSAAAHHGLVPAKQQGVVYRGCLSTQVKIAPKLLFPEGSVVAWPGVTACSFSSKHVLGQRQFESFAGLRVLFAIETDHVLPLDTGGAVEDDAAPTGYLRFGSLFRVVSVEVLRQRLVKVHIKEVLPRIPIHGDDWVATAVTAPAATVADVAETQPAGELTDTSSTEAAADTVIVAEPTAASKSSQGPPKTEASTSTTAEQQVQRAGAEEKMRILIGRVDALLAEDGAKPPADHSELVSTLSGLVAVSLELEELASSDDSSELPADELSQAISATVSRVLKFAIARMMQPSEDAEAMGELLRTILRFLGAVLSAKPRVIALLLINPATATKPEAAADGAEPASADDAASSDWTPDLWRFFRDVGTMMTSTLRLSVAWLAALSVLIMKNDEILHAAFDADVMLGVLVQVVSSACDSCLQCGDSEERKKELGELMDDLFRAISFTVAPLCRNAESKLIVMPEFIALLPKLLTVAKERTSHLMVVLQAMDSALRVRDGHENMYSGEALGSLLFDIATSPESDATIINWVLRIFICITCSEEGRTSPTYGGERYKATLCALAVQPDADNVWVVAKALHPMTTLPERYCNTEVRRALVSLSIACRTPKGVEWVCRTMCAITNDDEGKQLMCDPDVHDAVVRMSKYATGADAAEWLAGFIGNASASPTNANIFFTSAIRDVYVRLAPHAVSDDAVEWCCRTMGRVVQGIAEQVQRNGEIEGGERATNAEATASLYLGEVIRDTVVALALNITSSVSAVEWWGRLVHRILSTDPTTTPLYAVPKVRNTIVKLSKLADLNVVCVEALCRIMCSITTTEDEKALFATLEVVEALKALGGRVSHPVAAEWWAGVVNNILNTEVHVPLFATPDFVDVVVHVAHAAKSSDAAEWVARALCKLASSFERIRELFSTEAMRDALYALSEFATNDASVGWLCNSWNNVTLEHSNSEMYATEAFRDAMVQMLSYVRTAEPLDRILRTICNVIRIPEMKLMFVRTPVFIESIGVLANEVVCNEDGVEWICRLIASLVVEETTEYLLPYMESLKEMLVGFAEFTKGTDAVEWWCGLAHNLCNCTGDEKDDPSDSDNDDDEESDADGDSEEGDSEDSSSIEPTKDGEASTSGPKGTEKGSEVVEEPTKKARGGSLAVFVDPRIRDSLLFFAEYATSGESIEWLCRVVCRISISEKAKRMMGTKEVRDMLICLLAPRITSESPTYWLVSAVNNIAVLPDNRPLYADAEAIGTLVLFGSHYCKVSEQFRWLCGAMFQIALYHPSVQYFATRDMHDLLVENMLPLVTEDDDGALWAARLINELTQHAVCVKALVDQALVDSIVGLLARVKSDLGIEWALRAVCCTATPDACKPLFRTPSIYQTVVAVAKATTNPVTVEWVSGAINNFMSGEPCINQENPDVFATFSEPLAEAICHMMDYAHTADAMEWVVRAAGRWIVHQRRHHCQRTPQEEFEQLAPFMIAVHKRMCNFSASDIDARMKGPDGKVVVAVVQSMAATLDVIAAAIGKRLVSNATRDFGFWLLDQCPDPETTVAVAKGLCAITNSEGAPPLFANAAFRVKVLDLLRAHKQSSDVIEWMCGLVNNVAGDSTFLNAETNETLLALVPYAATDDARDWLVRVMLRLSVVERELYSRIKRHRPEAPPARRQYLNSYRRAVKCVAKSITDPQRAESISELIGTVFPHACADSCGCSKE